MKYLLPYERLKESFKLVSARGVVRVDITYDELTEIIKKVILGIEVDEKWYRAKYADVAEAIDAGLYKDAKHHFVAIGYFEGRRPFPVTVDEEWYQLAYPDVKEGVEQGFFRSPADHFEQHGYGEGRFPIPVSGLA